MPDLVIENWQYGLDARKSELTSRPGTLLSIVNAHINQGGEIEKRKAFIQTLLPTNSYGLEVTSSGLTVFGSVASGGLSPSLPAEFTYQRLQHPDGSTAMTGVVASRTFGGAAWVAAKFADGNTYGYYNGVLVPDFISGLILASENTNTKIGTSFAGLVNATQNYTAVDNGNGSVDVFGKAGTNYVETQTVVSASGTLTEVESSTGVAPTTGIAAQAQFSIQGGTASAGVNKVTSITVGGTQCLSGSVNWVTSNSATAAAIASNINGFSATSNYSATQSGNTVTISSTTANGGTANGDVLQVVAAGNVVIGQFSFFLSLLPGSTTFSTKTYVFANGVDLTNGGVSWSTDIPTTCAAIVTAINGYSGTSGYNAFCASGSTTILLSKLTTASNDAPVTITVSPGVGGQVNYGGPPQLTALVSPLAMSFPVTGSFGVVVESPTGVAGPVSVGFSGGIPPYTFSWFVNTGNIIAQPSLEGNTCTFILSASYQTTLQTQLINNVPETILANAAIATVTVVDSTGQGAQASCIVNY